MLIHHFIVQEPFCGDMWFLKLSHDRRSANYKTLTRWIRWWNGGVKAFEITFTWAFFSQYFLISIYQLHAKERFSCWSWLARRYLGGEHSSTFLKYDFMLQLPVTYFHFVSLGWMTIINFWVSVFLLGTTVSDHLETSRTFPKNEWTAC